MLQNISRYPLNMRQTDLGYKVIQYLIAITASLGIISTEMHMGWTSPSIPALLSGDYRIKISSDESSWLPVVLLSGAITGSILAGFITDICGRKNIMLFSTLPLTLGWIMIGLANSIYIIYIARYIAGISDGLLFSTVPMYLGEIAEPKIRGMISSICPVFIVSGVLLINALGNYLPIDIASFIASVVPIVQFGLLFWMPESPQYLIRKGHLQEAKRVLHILRGQESGDIEFDRLTNAYKEQVKAKMMDLFKTRSNRKAMFIVLALRTLQQLSGGTAIAFYCKTIFVQAKDFISPNVGTLIYFTVQLLVTAISSFIVDTSGRRPLFLISTFGTALSLFTTGGYLYVKNLTDLETLSFNFLPVLALLGFVIFFSIGIQTMPYLIGGEIFSPEIKSLAISSGSVYHAAVAILTSKFFHLSSDVYGMHVSFLVFGICCLLGMVWGYFYLPETKGKTLEDIQRELKGLPLEDHKTN